MIEDNIEKYKYSVLITGPDKRFELVAFVVILNSVSIARIWCEEAGRIISPVIKQLLSVVFSFLIQLIKFKYRHKLYCIHAELFEIRYLFDNAAERSAVLYA